MPNHPNKCPNCGMDKRQTVSDHVGTMTIYKCGSRLNDDGSFDMVTWCKNTAAAKNKAKK